MMVRQLKIPGCRALLIGGAFVSLAASFAKAELSLSPQPMTYELDGVPISQLAFENGTDRKSTYEPPGDWKYSGSRNQLELQPPGLSQTSVKITQASTGSAVTFDENGQKELQERAIASLPNGSQQVKIENAELNPLRIEGKQTYLVELSYVAFGETFSCYQLYLDRKPQPMIFRLSCRQADYPQLRAAFHKSLYSWQNL